MLFRFIGEQSREVGRHLFAALNQNSLLASVRTYRKEPNEYREGKAGDCEIFGKIGQVKNNLLPAA
jgi:hypothetical protein